MNLKKELTVTVFASALSLSSLGLAGCGGAKTADAATPAAEQGAMANCGAQAEHQQSGEAKGQDASCGANGCGAGSCGAEKPTDEEK